MKICVLVKEVPDAAVEKRIDPATGRMDRSGEKNLNPYDTHAIEAAMQIREGGVVPVEEIVAVTMGPESAVRALHKAVSLGADRSIHLSDEAVAGSDVAATGYALAETLRRENPDLVLLGQQSDDGECYAIGAVVAEHLGMPSLTQVIKMDIEGDKLRCERQAEYGYDTVEVTLPAVISVGDAINEPRYPSLKAIMGAKKKPLETVSAADVGIDAVARRRRQLRRPVGRREGPAGEVRRRDHRGRGHRRDGRTNRRLARRAQADLTRESETTDMANILIYALHYDGAINKNSLGAVSEGARLASQLGGEAHAILVGENVPHELAASLGEYGAKKVWVASGPDGLAQPAVDAMAKAITDGDYSYALFGGGLLGFEIGAGLAARAGAGVAMEVTGVRAEDGQLVAERPILGDSAISEIRFRSPVGIIIGRLNAFEITKDGAGAAEVSELAYEPSPQAAQATMVKRGEQRGADVDIEGADILVAGGRGLGNAEGFELCEQLAAAFGGNTAVAATRAVVDAGWYPYAAQIGQTGKTVAPKLYLAAGISGAIQHKVGMQASENIIAINKDANAPIFEFSDLGVVGDLNKILPKLTEAVKAKKGA